MKKYMLILVVILFACAIFAKETKVFDVTWKPQTYFEAFEHNFTDYWRFPDKNKDEIMKSDFGIMLKSFERNIVHLQTLLKYSGLHGIEDIECESCLVETEEKKYFRNTLNIELDEEKEGFLQGLLKKLPADKITALENEDGISDLHVISDDTLLAFSAPLNFIEAFKKVPENFVLRSVFKDFAAEFFDIGVDEFNDRITGEWGGVFYLNHEEYAKDWKLDFVFIVPDPGQKFYKTLGEKLVVRRMAVFKDKMLNVRIFAKYKDMLLLPVDNFLLIVSSPQTMLKFTDSGKDKKICDRIKKLNIPEDIEYDAFAYWNDKFSAVLFQLLAGGRHPVKFMADFAGNDCFSAVKKDDDELEVIQYSNSSLAEMLLMAYSVNIGLWADHFIYREGRAAFIEQKITDLNSECFEKMRKYAAQLKLFAEKNNGKYPQGINGAGLKKFADFAKIPYGDFSVTNREKKEIPFKRFYYWGENFDCNNANIPLMSDRGGIHSDKIHIIFCDGSVREFELENVRSARRIIGFLHTVFNYDSKTFSKLMKQAEKLDNEKL